MLVKISDLNCGKYLYKLLEDVEFDLKNVIHSTTGTTPSKLLFGINQRGKVIDGVAECLEQTEREVVKDLEHIRRKASENIVKFQTYNKSYFDKKRKEPHDY